MKTLLVLAFVGVAIFLFLKRRSPGGSGKAAGTGTTPRKRGKKAIEEEPSPYRATLIVPGAMACDAAKALAEKPFLDADRATPPLPLPNCTAPHCRCKYAHTDDRREQDIDRRFESGMQTQIYRTSGEQEKRSSQGRRKNDSGTK